MAYRRRTISSYFAIINSPGTYLWYKPYGAKIVKVQLWGGGGGGQGARGWITNQGSGTGGVGGQGGACIIRYVDAAQLARTTTLVVGARGSGGSAGGGPFANPPGTNGGDTSFGSFVAYGGVANADQGGQKGTAGALLPSTFGNHALGGALGYPPTAGWCTVYAGAQWGSASAVFGGAAGGTGGTSTIGGTQTSPGADGGIKGYYYTGGGGAGGIVGSDAPSCAGTWKGGGGGGANALSQGGRGGDGGYACGGGGGGGGYTGGAGGYGGPGYAIITVYW